MTRPLLAAGATLLLAGFASIAAPDGTFEGMIDAAGTPLNARVTFATEGQALSGSLELLDHGAAFPLDDGVAKGDSVFFTVDLAGMATFIHRGLVVGDTLRLLTNVGDGVEAPAVFIRVP